MYPVLNKKLVTTSLPFGVRYPNTPALRRLGLAGKRHKGIDIAPTAGNKRKAIHICAPVSGYVNIGGTSTTYPWRGIYVDICSTESDEGNRHLLCHLYKSFVKPGQYVKKGQSVGLMGTSGSSTAKHLHYEVKAKRAGKWESINPKEYLT